MIEVYEEFVAQAREVVAAGAIGREATELVDLVQNLVDLCMSREVAGNRSLTTAQIRTALSDALGHVEVHQ